LPTHTKLLNVGLCVSSVCRKWQAGFGPPAWSWTPCPAMLGLQVTPPPSPSSGGSSLSLLLQNEMVPERLNTRQYGTLGRNDSFWCGTIPRRVGVSQELVHPASVCLSIRLFRVSPEGLMAGNAAPLSYPLTPALGFSSSALAMGVFTEGTQGTGKQGRSA
jgi:hypothetical protein